MKPTGDTMSNWTIDMDRAIAQRAGNTGPQPRNKARDSHRLGPRGIKRAKAQNAMRKASAILAAAS
jgi:hypothetical protein